MGLKENIKSKRLELGLTLEEVANKIGVKKPTLQRYESGVISNIPSDKIEALAEVFDISPAYLMGWEEKSVSNKEIQNNLSLSKKEETLLHNFNKLNDIGKNEAIKRVEELTFLSRYSNSNNEYGFNTIAAHNDFVHDENERNLIKQDLEDMDNW